MTLYQQAAVKLNLLHAQAGSSLSNCAHSHLGAGIDYRPIKLLGLVFGMLAERYFFKKIETKLTSVAGNEMLLLETVL